MDIADIAFANAPVGLCLLENRVIRGCNALFAEVFGGRPADYADRPVADLYPSPQDYERIVDERWDPPVTAAVRLVSVIGDITQHVGQLSYVKGLLDQR